MARARRTGLLYPTKLILYAREASSQELGYLLCGDFFLPESSDNIYFLWSPGNVSRWVILRYAVNLPLQVLPIEIKQVLFHLNHFDFGWPPCIHPKDFFLQLIVALIDQESYGSDVWHRPTRALAVVIPSLELPSRR